MSRRQAVLAFCAYVLLAAAYTWPLLADATTRIAADPFDPVLNASILWWNATVVPFTASWWSPPYFFPAQQVAAFTENLVGFGPIATPIYWVVGQPILAYNLTFFLTWPLSALSAYLLVRFLLGRGDAAFVAGLAFGFAPYRLTQIGHIQVLAMFWLPIALLALHAHVATGRRRWLALFGIAWILQSLSNGYYMFFGGIAIGLWIAYFCSPRDKWRAVPGILLAWLIASIPVAAVMWQYRVIHEQYGLSRGLAAAIDGSAQPVHWLRTTDLNRFWSAVLPDAGAEFNLFPGVTAVAIVVLALTMFAVRRASGRETLRRHAMRIVLAAIAFLGATVAFAIAADGRLTIDLLVATVRMSTVSRAVAITTVAAVVLAILTPAIRARLRDRSVFGFYCAATLGAAVLACGPEIRRGSDVLIASAPYKWLMLMPGLDGLRVVARFWMVGALCLAVAAASAYVWLVPRTGMRKTLAFACVCVGLLLDAWPARMPMAPAPAESLSVEARGDAAAVIELPLGPAWDAAATIRSIGHRRRVVNGVSGYDPPHYLPLQLGLTARDPSVLLALASFGPLDVVLNMANDPDRSLARYVESIPTVSKSQQDGALVRYRLPEVAPPALGSPLAASTVVAGGQPILDVGSALELGGIEIAIGRDLSGFPHQVVVEASLDRVTWRDAWRGSTLGALVRGAALNPADIRVAVPFEASARFLRLSPLGEFNELRVFAARVTR